MEMWSQAKSIDNSKKISRTVVVVLPHQNFHLDAKTRKKSQTYSGIFMALDKIKMNLDDRIDILNSRCEISVPYLNIKVISADRDENDTSVIELKESYRMITVLAPNVEYVLNAEECEESNISHLIQININSQLNVRTNLINAYYNVQEEDVVNIITDILLDIAMYHSWFFGDKEKDEDINFRKEISKKKVEYISTKGFAMKYGEPKLEDTYCCFAAACYNNNDFNYDMYETLWKEFVKKYIEKQTQHNTIEEQLKSFKNSKQISEKKVKNQYKELDDGKYLLIVTRREPHYGKIKKQICTKMGLPKWKNGKTKFVKYADYINVARWYPYVALYIVNKFGSEVE